MSDHRCAYVDKQILFMTWNNQKDGWIPDTETMDTYLEGGLRVYRPSDSEYLLVTMPGHILWPVKSDPYDILSVPELPWIPVAMQGVKEDEIDAFDEYILSSDEVILMSPVHPAPTSGGSRPEARTSVRTKSEPIPLPVHIQAIVLERAESERKTCSISMEPIRKHTSTVTSCGHVFQKEAIQEWLSSHRTCPECRQICSI